MLGDGNDSDLDEDSAAGNDEAVDASPTVAVAARRRASNANKQKPFTLPIRSTRSARPPLPTSFFSDSGPRITRRRSNIGLARSRTSSLRLPDRFIPLRTQSANTTERYRTGKEWNELTPTERILRHSGAAEDAFVYRRGVVTPLAHNFRLQSRSDTVASTHRGRSSIPYHQSLNETNRF